MPSGYPNDGRQFRGENNHYAKVTEEMVRRIREARAAIGNARRVAKDHPASLHSLGLKFGLKPSQVSKVALGRAWSHVR